MAIAPEPPPRPPDVDSDPDPDAGGVGAQIATQVSATQASSDATPERSWLQHLRMGAARFAVRSLTLAASGHHGSRHPSSANLVEEHQLELFAQHFPIWISGFAIMNYVAAPLTLGLFAWVAVAYGFDKDSECDQPLRIWALVEFANTALGIVHVVIMNCFCGQGGGSDSNGYQEPFPLYGKVYAGAIAVFDLIWLSIGLYWTRQTKTCWEVVPNLTKAIHVYSISSSLCLVFVTLNVAGLYTILSWMLRNGMLSTIDAAPPGTVNRLKLLKFDPELQIFQDNPDCSICFSSFAESGNGEIRLTGCNHAFHDKCLGNWLRMKRACPLCRGDVVAGLAGEGKDHTCSSGRSIPGVMQHVIGWPETNH